MILKKFCDFPFVWFWGVIVQNIGILSVFNIKLVFTCLVLNYLPPGPGLAIQHRHTSHPVKQYRPTEQLIGLLVCFLIEIVFSVLKQWSLLRQSLISTVITLISGLITLLSTMFLFYTVTKESRC